MRSYTLLSFMLLTLAAAACSADSPTGTGLTSAAASLKQAPGCTFVTPSNGKAHTASANSSKCPTAADLAGEYEPVRFILHEGGETFNFLDYEEVIFYITLNPDGTTSGRFFVPQSVNEDGTIEEGSGINVSLAGTFQLNGNQLTFDHAEETFVEELTFTIRGNRLVAGGNVSPNDPFGLEIVLSPVR